MFKKEVALAQEYLGLLLLNVFDLFLTGYIFSNKGAEANAFPGWVLRHYGLSGFAVFKFLMVAFIIGVCEVIAQSNVRTARLVVTFGCLIYLIVVLYECYGIVKFIYLPQLN